MNLFNSQLYWGIISIVVALFDWGTKILASSRLIYNQSVELIPFFDLTLLRNYGISFGFLNIANSMQVHSIILAIIVIVAIIILYYLLIPPIKNKILTSFALSLILGGSIGNVFDRINRGYIIDFIDIHLGYYHWYIFNIADISICLGIIFLIFAKIIKSGPEQKNLSQ